MVSSVRSWIDRRRIASVLVITYAFTGTIQGFLAASGMGAPWTLSIVVGFGGFEPLVCAAVAVVLAFGTERLSAHDVPDSSGLELNGGDPRPTIRRECKASVGNARDE